MFINSVNQFLKGSTLREETQAVVCYGESSWEPNANIGREQSVMVLFQDHRSQRALRPMKWGYKAYKGSKSMLNARNDTMTTSIIFKPLLQKGQRCVIPVKGLYPSNICLFFIYVNTKEGLYRYIEFCICLYA